MAEGGWPRRVAIIHYWLVGMRGGERVLEELLRLYPDAEIFTHVADPEKLSPLLAKARIHRTFISKLPYAKKHYQKYLALMPLALEELDLTGFDLVISSESGPAKGVIVPPDALHVCYTHTPMRYIWDHYPLYRTRLGRISRWYFSILAHRLRIWDVSSAARVDAFVANSSFVAARIRKYYRREAAVVNPPVDLASFHLPEGELSRDHYLFVSELVPYKRVDLVFEAFRGTPHLLRVVGQGPEYRKLASNLPKNVELLGHVSLEELRRLYQSARALVFPAEEDFGIVPLEAMACGTPVIAYGRGGIIDSVLDGKTGLFFGAQTAEDIRAAVENFEANGVLYSPREIADHVGMFSANSFRRNMAKAITTARMRQNSRTSKPDEHLTSEDAVAQPQREPA